jgi:hypothetical protein
MDAPTMRKEILEMLDRLTPEQLETIRQFVTQISEAPVSGLYALHEHAISTGVPDLAEQHDRYLYERAPYNE